MNMDRRHWIHRKTPEGDLYYNTETRKVYRTGAPIILGISHDLYSLPTYDFRAPIKVYFDFTYLCNLECRHCITNSSPKVDKQSELTSEDIISVMNELAGVGVLEIGIGGGEPLCHPDIFLFLDHARAVGLNVVLTTNGILVTPDYAKRIKNCQISEVRVSFDGSQAVHDSIRGSGTYQKALKALRILTQNKVRTVPRLTICNDDKTGLDILFKNLAATGVSTIKAALLEPRGRAALKENRDLFRYPRDTTTAEFLWELAQKYSLQLQLPDDLAFLPALADGEDLRRGERRSCSAGIQTAYISPYGDVQPCSGIPNKIFGNVTLNSFMSAWNSDDANTWRKYANSHDSWKICTGMKELLQSDEILQVISQGLA